ncbi:helix-turn-helix transcriptional regulator [Serratia ureilytica]|uniref:helix-turn-helix transcriptional regulator n=1 Tax=Serratia ureilytica TaxID=300181 RepID=UPI001C121FB6|nr:LuxR family transcriptional regulator [Serratia ureilytica]MBU5413211.1 LuxR C-terminal-related transcriptional regulator [Serratia ureilytica]
MKNINIVIDDENRYFTAGLRFNIEEYARINNKTVCFLTPGDAERPDVVFASSLRRVQRWHRASQAGAPQVVTVKERRIFTASDRARTLYRTDDQSKLFELLVDVLSGDEHSVFVRRQVLTRRERQVVDYLRSGLDQSQTARLLGLSVKTIHSHKRSVMSKLMLNRHHDFIYWMLSREGEYS